LIISICKTFDEELPTEKGFDLIMKAADQNWDGKISFDEFIEFMKDFPLLLEMYRDS
jgi:Ca2+-binding EF-hand superfamily protein